jgi:uncharacterized protein with PIN domain
MQTAPGGQTACNRAATMMAKFGDLPWRAGYCRWVPAAAASIAAVAITASSRPAGVFSIGERECDFAEKAYAEYGKGRHPAALNMGDCYAYACARANRAKLLFKGKDFTKTDILSAR